MEVRTHPLQMLGIPFAQTFFADLFLAALLSVPASAADRNVPGLRRDLR